MHVKGYEVGYQTAVDAEYPSQSIRQATRVRACYSQKSTDVICDCH